ncbi:DUF397 domain-containing protein [Streptomyces sp. NPDC054794]
MQAACRGERPATPAAPHRSRDSADRSTGHGHAAAHSPSPHLLPAPFGSRLILTRTRRIRTGVQGKCQGGSLVQVDFTGASWCRSSACGDGASCVEVAHTVTSIGVRDSRGAILVFSELAWQLFATAFQARSSARIGVGAGGVDLPQRLSQIRR